jgi:hypothetical protein
VLLIGLLRLLLSLLLLEGLLHLLLVWRLLRLGLGLILRLGLGRLVWGLLSLLELRLLLRGVLGLLRRLILRHLLLLCRLILGLLLLVLMLGLGLSRGQHGGRRGWRLHRVRMCRLSVLILRVLQAVHRLLWRRQPHGMGVRRHGSLSIHSRSGMRAKTGHGVHTPLKALQR